MNSASAERQWYWCNPPGSKTYSAQVDVLLNNRHRQPGSVAEDYTNLSVAGRDDDDDDDH